jgi:GTPase SAR1 family protein
MLGPSDAGKTTILYRLKDDRLVLPPTTFYTNTEFIPINGMTLEIWDITNFRNVHAMRPHNLWMFYLQHSHGIIYVVDSTEDEPSRKEETKQELWAILNNQGLVNNSPKMPLLVYANKQDISYSMIVAEVRDMLDLESIPSERPWHIQGVSVVTGQGLKEGMDWLTTQLKAEQS